jgi:ribosomal-protein-alanine N-acetyltransferase
MDSVVLKPVSAEDALPLFPMVFHTPVTDTLQWDGPISLEEYVQGIGERARRVQAGESHLFTIFVLSTGKPIGMIDVRPGDDPARGDIGLWIGQPYQGKGFGTQAVRKIVEYGFDRLGMQKIEAFVFVGNRASRRIFEKNGFQLEGTIRKACRKGDQMLDEWLLGITREDYLGLPE